MGRTAEVVDVKRSKWDAAKRYAGMGSACFVIATAGLSMVLCVTAAFGLGLLLPVFVSGLCNLMLGGLMLCLQLNSFSGTISKYFGFLDMWVGRGIFYLFVGNNSLCGGKDQELTHIASYVVFGCCWFVGLCELCGPKSRHHVGDAMLDPASGAAAQQDGSITINLTPGQVAAGANFVANNADVGAARFESATPGSSHVLG